MQGSRGTSWSKDSVDSAAGKLNAASKKILRGAASTAGGVQDAAEKTLNKTTSAVTDTMFPECPVPTFMLPTGPSPEDYALLFQFDEVLDNLESGILVRPKIEVWAARESGHDLERFGRELKQDFVRQFNEARESLIEAAGLILTISNRSGNASAMR